MVYLPTNMSCTWSAEETLVNIIYNTQTTLKEYDLYYEYHNVGETRLKVECANVISSEEAARNFTVEGILEYCALVYVYTTYRVYELVTVQLNQTRYDAVLNATIDYGDGTSRTVFRYNAADYSEMARIVRSFVHSYPAQGDYRTTMVICNAWTCRILLAVVAIRRPLRVEVNEQPYVYLRNSVKYAVLSLYEDEQSFLSLSVDFGDGTNESLTESRTTPVYATHTYSASGEFNVTMTIDNDLERLKFNRSFQSLLEIRLVARMLYNDEMVVARDTEVSVDVQTMSTFDGVGVRLVSNVRYQWMCYVAAEGVDVQAITNAIPSPTLLSG